MSVTIYHVNFSTGEMIIEHDGRYLSALEEEERHRQRVKYVEQIEIKERHKRNKTKVSNQ